MDEDKQGKWGFIYCPKSGSLRPQKRWERIEKSLKSKGIDYDMVMSESSSGVERLVTMMINNDYRTIIMVGGDSALNDAVNCLMLVEKKVRERIVLGVIPNGLINDFAKFWGFKEGYIEQNIEALRIHRIKKIDLGCIRYENNKGERCKRYFLNCLNVGLAATVANLRRKTRNILGLPMLSFIPSSLLMIFQRLEYHMKIKIDTETIDKKVMTVCVGNATGYGMTPNGVPYNGLLDVSVVSHPEMTQLIEGFYLLYSGKILNHKDVRPYRIREMLFEKTHKAPVGIDGRLMNTPVGAFKVQVEEEVINFLIPN